MSRISALVFNNKCLSLTFRVAWFASLVVCVKEAETYNFSKFKSAKYVAEEQQILTLSFAIEANLVAPTAKLLQP